MNTIQSKLPIQLDLYSSNLITALDLQDKKSIDRSTAKTIDAGSHLINALDLQCTAEMKAAIHTTCSISLRDLTVVRRRDGTWFDLKNYVFVSVLHSESQHPHYFEKTFLSEWLEKNPTCPVCREPQFTYKKALEKVTENGLELEFLASEFRNDKNICLAAIKQTIKAFQFVPETYKSDPEFFLVAIEEALKEVSENGLEFEFLSPELQCNKNICLAAIKEKIEAFQFIPAAYKSDPEFCLVAIKYNAHVFAHISEDLKNNEEFRLDAIQINHWVFAYLPRKDQLDKKFCVAALNRNSWVFDLIPRELLDKEICLVAVKQYSWRFQEIPEVYRSDSDICLAVIASDPNIFISIPDCLKNNKEFCFKALETNSAVFNQLPQAYQKDPTFILVARKKEAMRLFNSGPILADGEGYYNSVANSERYYCAEFRKLDDSIRMDPEVIQAAMKATPKILAYVPEHLRSKEICLSALSKDKEARQHIPDWLKNADREFCLFVYKELTFGQIAAGDPLALARAPFYVKQERDICLAAVQNNGLALEFVPMQLKDYEICKVAIERNWRAFKFIPGPLRSWTNRLIVLRGCLSFCLSLME